MIECQHPKIGTCKTCKLFTMSFVKRHKECECKNCYHFTQSDIDKYHAERLKEAEKILDDGWIGSDENGDSSYSFKNLAEMREIIESVMRCLEK